MMKLITAAAVLVAATFIGLASQGDLSWGGPAGEEPQRGNCIRDCG